MQQRAPESFNQRSSLHLSDSDPHGLGGGCRCSFNVKLRAGGRRSASDLQNSWWLTRDLLVRGAGCSGRKSRMLLWSGRSQPLFPQKAPIRPHTHAVLDWALAGNSSTRLFFAFEDGADESAAHKSAPLGSAMNPEL